MGWGAHLNAVPAPQRCPHCDGELPAQDRPREETGDWNYTHNTSRMIYDALNVVGITLAEDENWWKHLNGMSGADGKTYLSAIITQLEAEPAKYKPMNPANGWGDYDGLLSVLREMRDAVPDDCASQWWAGG